MYSLCEEQVMIKMLVIIGKMKNLITQSNCTMWLVQISAVPWTGTKSRILTLEFSGRYMSAFCLPTKYQLRVLMFCFFKYQDLQK